ncbi:RND transporter [Shimia sp. SDUM112013]|uniref:RND transporter n=1 Tax=Shimia sp. SDUM112013 TaxID=3136160 RepID=UPI0032EC1852
MNALDKVSWTLVLTLILLLGFAPFVPEPHVWEKLKMLAAGTLVRPIDWLDLVFHGAPFVLLVLKVAREWRKNAE